MDSIVSNQHTPHAIIGSVVAYMLLKDNPNRIPLSAGIGAGLYYWMIHYGHTLGPLASTSTATSTSTVNTANY